jgi:YkoY family integral membrane protein
MDFLSGFSGFSWASLVEILTSATGWGMIFSLVILEGLLSTDNAMVLAVMVEHLPEKQRKRALIYGLWGAYGFRFLAIGFLTILVKLSFIKILGAGYLAYLTIMHFVKDEDEQAKKLNYGFWKTVMMVEVMDVVFSADSILASLAVSDKVWILLIGGMLGILMMRGVAQLFIKIMEKVPEFKDTAYVIIGFIAFKMGLAIFEIHMPESVFIGVMAVLLGGTVALNKYKANKQSKIVKTAV